MRLLTFFCLIILCCISFTIAAQPGPPPPDPGAPVPFSGLYLLIASGVALGISKLKKKDK